MNYADSGHNQGELTKKTQSKQVLLFTIDTCIVHSPNETLLNIFH